MMPPVTDAGDRFEPRFEYRSIKGLRLHCAVAGKQGDPLIVLLHGFPEFWFAWREYFEPLVRAGYRVIAPDQRGYNLSDKPRRVREYSLDHLSSDVLELARWEGAKTFNVVGHDWGGAVGWWLGMKHPNHIRRLVVMNAPHPLVMRRYMLGNVEQMRKAWYMFFFQLPWFPERQLMAGGGHQFWGAVRDGAQRGCFDKSLRDAYIHAWRQPGAMRSMLHWYRASVRENLLHGKRQAAMDPTVGVPTSILWGKQDRVMLDELALECLEVCENGALRYFEGATHWVQHEEREPVIADILEFLAD